MLTLSRAWSIVPFATILFLDIANVQSAAGGVPPGMSLTCQFTSGPRSGTTFDFSTTPGATPAPIGAPCTDGAGSFGRAIAQRSK